MAKRRITRKEFMKLSAAAGVTAAIAACSPAAPAPTEAPKEAPKTAEPTKAPEPTKPSEPAKTPAAGGQATPTAAPAKSEAAATGKLAKVSNVKPAKFNESPMLAELVKAGKLPPVEKRLPEEPLVIEPAEIGQYGGTLRCGNIGTDYMGWDVSLVSYENGGGLSGSGCVGGL